jgi:hypothetical protein
LKTKNKYLPRLPVTELYVAEYSPSQNCFHHQTLTESMRDAHHHLKWGAGAKDYDWILFFVGTKSDAWDAIDQMAKIQEQVQGDSAYLNMC